ncbi:MAG TPA: bifunctional hydroxymethylpyrimidine kinase/phosphomethylpyrimidine kinase [Desulfosporosinus sp.]|nr:bifunctional hydroxymethylpyrimidine kinase/phosphomethylpyrimidine kinase [Desulfosporosinus sp.]
MKKVLTIAGSDCSGGAGIQADLKTFSAHGVYGMSVITAVTAQNTQGVFAVQDISRDVIAKQIESIFDDIVVDGVKVGMVSQVQTIEVIVEQLRHYVPQMIIVDPVMVSKSGYHLLNPEAEVTLIKELLPLAMLVTPNIPEAEVMTKMSICNLEQMKEASKIIYQMGVRNILLKGGHLEEDAIDILYDGQEFSYFSSARIATKNTHGTGCTLSSAITSNLALGYSLNDSVSLAKEYITIAIQHALSIGKGVGPTHHFYTLYKKAGLI